MLIGNTSYTASIHNIVQNSPTKDIIAVPAMYFVLH